MFMIVLIVSNNLSTYQTILVPASPYMLSNKKHLSQDGFADFCGSDLDDSITIIISWLVLEFNYNICMNVGLGSGYP
ncbi:MAG: hypothetical protein FD133_654 [Erysipelotrichaceae bacterium]|nr:MAG: hypothetical protein FD133_654 [Erysipelotrichaceae bacterium]